MKLLIVTNLFPNCQEPNRSPFNLQQFVALAKFSELKVVAPVPLFSYNRKSVPATETIEGIEVFHPRYLAIPKVLRITHGPAFFLGILHTMTSIRHTFDYEAVLACWAYPDAFGAALATKFLRKRLYTKVQGSDINLAHKYFGRVHMVRWALNHSEKIVAVSRPLKEKLAAIGIPEDKVVVIPNGLDKAKFFPRDRHECRKRLGLSADKKYILFIGNLSEVKGCEYLIRALARLKMEGLETIVVGDGPLRKELEMNAERLRIRNCILFRGREPHEDIPLWLAAADILCLPSLSEGCPNVVLEALACQVRVVASAVGGVPDLIGRQEGWLAKPADADDLARCLKLALTASDSNLSSARTMSWEENAAQLYRILSCDLRPLPSEPA